MFYSLVLSFFLCSFLCCPGLDAWMMLVIVMVNSEKSRCVRVVNDYAQVLQCCVGPCFAGASSAIRSFIHPSPVGDVRGWRSISGWLDTAISMYELTIRRIRRHYPIEGIYFASCSVVLCVDTGRGGNEAQQR